MKKILTKILLGFLCVVIIAVSGLCAYLFGNEKPGEVKRPTVTDASGNVYLAVVGENGETYAAVTDDVGNIYAAELDNNGNIGGNVADLNDKINLDDIPKNYDGPKVDETVTGNAYTGQAIIIETTTSPVADSTTAPTVTNPSQVTTSAPSQSTPQGSTAPAPSQGSTAPSAPQSTAPSSTNPPSTAAPTAPSAPQNTTAPSSPSAPKAYKIEKYQKMFAAETYFMEFTTNDADLGDTPIIAAAKNGNVLVEASVEGIACKILYIADTDTTYIILDNWRKYSKLPPELMGEDFNMNELNMGANFASDIEGKEISVKTVEIGGKRLTCESYYTDKGVLMEYYFDGDSFVRLDSTGKDGQVSSTYISKLTTDVPDSTFEIPDGYGYINLSWLSMMENAG